jgi:hypothetical protein
MKKEELKKILKPLVRECVNESIKEVLLESGLLKTVISEVLKGVSGKTIKEEKTVTDNQSDNLVLKEKTNDFSSFKRNLNLDENKNIKTTHRLDEAKKVLDEIGKKAWGGIDIFKNINDVPPEDLSVSSNSVLSSQQNLKSSEGSVDLNNKLFDFKKAKQIVFNKKERK